MDSVGEGGSVEEGTLRRNLAELGTACSFPEGWICRERIGRIEHNWRRNKKCACPPGIVDTEAAVDKRIAVALAVSLRHYQRTHSADIGVDNSDCLVQAIGGRHLVDRISIRMQRFVCREVVEDH
jgi:hypothetical protein